MAVFTDGTTSGVVTKEVAPNAGVKFIKVFVPATFAWGTDSIVVDLTKYGMRNVSAFWAQEETTAGSILVAGTGTTSVTTGTLTFVSTGSSANTCGGSLFVIGY
jgi:hypothetical protein